MALLRSAIRAAPQNYKHLTPTEVRTLQEALWLVVTKRGRPLVIEENVGQVATS
jgi:hypothetical protein